MGYAIKQAQTAQPLMFLMIDSTDHISGKTGLTPTVTLSKNGAAFASPAGTVSEVGNGWYSVAGNATDSGTLGPLKLHASSAGADVTDESFDVVAYDPQSATSLGLTNLANAQTGDVFGLVNPLITSGALTGAALANVPKSGYKLASDGVDAVVIETNVNFRQATSIIFSYAAGLLSGVDTGSPVFKAGGAGNSATTRISAATAASGRTTVTLALPT